jgi:hypothetical protein
MIELLPTDEETKEWIHQFPDDHYRKDVGGQDVSGYRSRYITWVGNHHLLLSWRDRQLCRIYPVDETTRIAILTRIPLRDDVDYTPIYESRFRYERESEDKDRSEAHRSNSNKSNATDNKNKKNTGADDDSNGNDNSDRDVDGGYHDTKIMVRAVDAFLFLFLFCFVFL